MIVPIAIAIFFRMNKNILELWTQTRTDDGPFHGLWEFPGGKIESHETPFQAVIREVKEEVGLDVDPLQGELMGIYDHHFAMNPHATKKNLLHVFLFPEHPQLINIGQWLKIEKDTLSAPYEKKIPYPNHRIIDDLFRALYSDP